MPEIRIRARITIRTSGYLTDAHARYAWHNTRVAPGIPIDLHITGHLTGVGPWALHPIGGMLADASEVTITTDYGPDPAVADALLSAVRAAIDAEHELRSTHTIPAGGGR